jgi:5-methylthioribose kinase
MIKLDNQLETINNYLKDKNWIAANEKVESVEKPGDGNMNFTLRCRTSNDRTFILKQSRDFVEKFPQVPAPAERVLREAEFYDMIKKMKSFNKVRLFNGDVILIILVNLSTIFGVIFLGWNLFSVLFF